VVSLHKRSLFLLVKCSQNLMSVCCAAGQMHQVLHAVVNMPVVLNIMNVTSLMVLSVRGSPLVTKMHWISHSHSHKFSMGSSGVQMVAMLAQLFSNLVHVMGP